MKDFDLLVFICRAQPLHLGHEHVIRQALEKTEKLLILVGSANMSRSIRNPFTYEERLEMITSVFHSELEWQQRVVIKPLNDYLYNDNGWMVAVQKIVENINVPWWSGRGPKIGLVGYAKDYTSYYLKMFPDWGSLDITSQFSTFNSTDIRNMYFRNMPILPHAVCSNKVVSYLESFMYKDEFRWLVQEANFVKEYKKSWSASPFPPVFQTVDAVVIQSGHVLLINRGNEGGSGLIALPGGFLNVKETLLQSVLRELREETNISDDRGEIPAGVLQSFITREESFDHPDRSTRGRTITRAFLFELPNKKNLYKVKGGDDAVHAQWYKIGTVDSTQFFEDHYFIMSKMLGLTIE